MKFMHWWMWLMLLSVMRHIQKKSSYQTTFAKFGQLIYVMSHLNLCEVDALVICPPFRQGTTGLGLVVMTHGPQ
jgi:hypothetical protein